MKCILRNLTVAALFVTVAPVVHAQTFLNPSFETPPVAVNNFVFEPGDSGWIFTGSESGDSGIANGSGAWGTGAASGQQYAFIQSNSSLSQTVSNLVPGNQYQLKFAMTRRNGEISGYKTNHIEIDMDSTALNVIYPADEVWRTYTSTVFTATATSVTFRFKGLTTTGDAALLDAVSITTPSPSMDILQNGGFEIPNFAPGGWSYETNYLDGGGWYFSPETPSNGGAGTASAGSPWGNSAFAGSQFAYVQRAGFITQSLQNLVVGKQYYITFEDSFRPATAAHGLNILVGGNLVLDTLSNSTAWSLRRTLPFTATSSEVTLRFEGIDGGQDAASLLDDVRVLDYSGYSTISGTLQFQDIVAYGSPQDIAFVFRPVSGGSAITTVVSVPPSGAFSIPFLPSAKYTLHIKGDKYLAANVSVDATNGDVSGVTAFLHTGDADNNNVIDIGDFGVLVSAYGSESSVPTSGYNANADFNGDGTVDISDFALLVANYGAKGDN